MREILYRGKRIDNGEWVYGLLLETPIREYREYGSNFYIVRGYAEHNDDGWHFLSYLVDEETISQYTGVTDKNGIKIFEGDIVQYLTFDDFDCQSVVKFGEYKQDGSGGEYRGRDCLGFYVEVDNFTCPDWCENEPEQFEDFQKQQNILEIADKCEVIGNIYDNPELLIN